MSFERIRGNLEYADSLRGSPLKVRASNPNPAELDKYLNEIISCQKNAEIVSKVLKIEIIPFTGIALK